MKSLAIRIYVKLQTLKDGMKDENGQDMVEYAIVMGLIAMGATVAMKALAVSIGGGFTSIGTKLTNYTT